MAARKLRIHHLLSACSCVMLTMVTSGASFAAEAADAQSGGTDEEILVIGTRYLSGIQPERDLDQEGIESYGQSTIDELIAEVQGELGDDEPPLIIVNGERIENLDEVGSLPVEALENVKVLPRGSGVRAGGRASQRVVNITLKKMARSATALLAPKLATDGDWSAGRAEGILTYIRDSTRANLTFKARHETDLLESQRDIDQPDTPPVYAQSGNVVGYPDTIGEIDPLLSAAAGELVTVTPIPGGANPSLADFAANANDPAFTDLGDFRTLRPRTRNYDLTGTFATRLTPWLTGNATFRLGHAKRRSLRGLPQALFVVSPTNASTPFSTTVAIAEYGQDPFATRSERDSGDLSLSLNGRFGEWASLFNASHFQSKDVTRTERQAAGSTITLADDVNPFAADLFGMVGTRTDKATAKTWTSKAKLSATGPLVELPAGAVQTTFEGQYIRNHLRSESEFALISQTRNSRRSETSLRGAVDVPITTRDGFGGEIGDLNVSAEYSRVHYSDAGSVSNYQFGVGWEPRPVLRLTAEVEETKLPASVYLLGNPTVVTSGVRTFDPLTGESVDVTQITGGNPDLAPEKYKVIRVAALVRLLNQPSLQLSAEYTDTNERNFVSSLPEASAAVMVAFPERFIRDADGVLTTVDLRPANFDSHREKRFRYGLTFNKRLGGGGAAEAAPLRALSDDESGDNEDEAANREPRPRVSRARRGPGTRVSLTASHSIVFQDEIVIRQGLGTVDLLDGGAIGIGGGRVRHQVDGTASISSGGTGLRVNALWRGKSTLNALDEGSQDRLRFSPVFTVNLRAFADVHRFQPDSDWARGMRVSLNILNLTNDRQEVRDSSGNTPLRYQPGYRDAVGRTIELELRKVF